MAAGKEVIGIGIALISLILELSVWSFCLVLDLGCVQLLTLDDTVFALIVASQEGHFGLSRRLRNNGRH